MSTPITCFTGGGDFGVDLYMASLIGGTIRGNAMPADHTQIFDRCSFSKPDEALHASVNMAYPLLKSYNSR